MVLLLRGNLLILQLCDLLIQLLDAGCIGGICAGIAAIVRGACIGIRGRSVSTVIGIAAGCRAVVRCTAAGCTAVSYTTRTGRRSALCSPGSIFSIGRIIGCCRCSINDLSLCKAANQIRLIYFIAALFQGVLVFLQAAYIVSIPGHSHAGSVKLPVHDQHGDQGKDTHHRRIAAEVLVLLLKLMKIFLHSIFHNSPH